LSITPVAALHASPNVLDLQMRRSAAVSGASSPRLFMIAEPPLSRLGPNLVSALSCLPADLERQNATGEQKKEAEGSASFIQMFDPAYSMASVTTVV
jgi:hypothetical protein